MDPAGGSTVNAATAATATASSSRTGSSAPRRSAASPAITPPPPARAAAHRAVLTTVSGTCGATPQGGPVAGRMSLGISQLLRMTEAAIMIRTELMIPAAASQARFRPARLGGGRRSAGGFGTPGCPAE